MDLLGEVRGGLGCSCNFVEERRGGLVLGRGGGRGEEKQMV